MADVSSYIANITRVIKFKNGKWRLKILWHCCVLKIVKTNTLEMDRFVYPITFLAKEIMNSVLFQFSSVKLLNHVQHFETPWTAVRQATLSTAHSQSCSNPCPVSWWCHPTFSSSVVPFSSRLQSFPASGSFPMSQFFASGDQSIGTSASTSVLPMNIQDWFPLGLIGLTSLQSKGVSRVFSNTTVQKHQFFGTQLSL